MNLIDDRIKPKKRIWYYCPKCGDWIMLKKKKLHSEYRYFCFLCNEFFSVEELHPFILKRLGCTQDFKKESDSMFIYCENCEEEIECDEDWYVLTTLEAMARLISRKLHISIKIVRLCRDCYEKNKALQSLSVLYLPNNPNILKEGSLLGDFKI